MPMPIMGVYTSFEFTEEELKVAKTFNALQKMYLQSLRYNLVIARDQMPPNYDNPHEYFHQRALHDGMIAQLTILLEEELDSSDGNNPPSEEISSSNGDSAD